MLSGGGAKAVMLEWLVLASLYAATAFMLHVEHIRTVRTVQSRRLKKYENERSIQTARAIPGFQHNSTSYLYKWQSDCSKGKLPLVLLGLGGDSYEGGGGGKFGIRCRDVTGDKEEESGT